MCHSPRRSKPGIFRTTDEAVAAFVNILAYLFMLVLAVALLAGRGPSPADAPPPPPATSTPITGS